MLRGMLLEIDLFTFIFSKSKMHSVYFLAFFFVLLYTFNNIHADEAKIKKDPRDFTENDVNKLFEEWEVMEICISI
jgi:hypothetical protein